MNKLSNVLWGFVLIGLGVIFGLNALDIAYINIFFDGWWTLFIIVPCFIGLFEDKDKTGNIIGLVVGICLFLSCIDVLDFEIVWKLSIPTILVLIGLSIIFRDSFNKKVKNEVKKLQANNDNKNEYTATFGGQDIDFSNEVFNGCNLSSVFGGITCDLRDATIENDSVINVSSIFSGITIYVPKDVNVKVTSTPIFGGVSDDRKKKTSDSKITIYISATCLFGGVEIK